MRATPGPLTGDGETWRALPAGHVVTWVKDWE